MLRDLSFADVIGAVALALIFVAGVWIAYGTGLPGTEGL